MSTPAEDSPQSRAVTLSNAITKLHRDNYGRGPTKVRTVIGYDHVICFLEDIYTPAERTLIEAGEAQAVVEMRRAFQRAMEARFSEAVEEVTGRKVRAFLSQTHIGPDISCEVFVLERDSADHAPEGVG